jgi:hypothetical protein
MIVERRMRLAGHAVRMEVKGNEYRILVGKPERKRPLGRPRRRWVNMKMDGVLLAGLIWLRIGTTGGTL